MSVNHCGVGTQIPHKNPATGCKLRVPHSPGSWLRNGLPCLMSSMKTVSLGFAGLHALGEILGGNHICPSPHHTHIPTSNIQRWVISHLLYPGCSFTQYTLSMGWIFHRRIFLCSKFFGVFLRVYFALAGVAQWIEHRLWTNRLSVQFPVRAHACVAGQVTSGSHMRGNHTLMYLSFSFSFPSTLSKNK